MGFYYSNKYGNHKAKVDGMIFDSKREANRYIELRLLEKAGEISDLQTQVKFVLIPTQREESTEVYKSGPKKGLPKPGLVIEREVTYIADFVYIDNLTKKKVVEDTKGYATKDYIIKRKLLLWLYGLKIREI